MDFENSVLCALVLSLVVVIVLLASGILDLPTNTPRDAEIDDMVIGVSDGIEYHVATAGINNEKELIDFIKDNNGEITQITYASKTPRVTTNVTITWQKEV